MAELFPLADLGGTSHVPSQSNFSAKIMPNNKLANPRVGAPSGKPWIHHLELKGKTTPKQECIPVGCVPSAAVAVSGEGVSPMRGGWVHLGGVCLREVSESEVTLNPCNAFSDVGYLSYTLTVESPIIVQTTKIRSTVILLTTSKMLT